MILDACCTCVYDADSLVSRLLPVFARAEEGLAHRIMEDCGPYVPYDTGALSRSVYIREADGEHRIIWDMPYAAYVYDGDERGVTFHKTHHPLACAHWAQRAKAAALDAWLSGVRDDTVEIGGRIV
ncbi:MAG: minor capsid protein [Eubacteriales bacterium]